MSSLVGNVYPKLICPVCRRVEQGIFRCTQLSQHPAGWQCSDCRAIFPQIDNTPIILRDVDTWLQEELIGVVARKDIPNDVFQRLLQAQSPLRRSQLRIHRYRQSPSSPASTWMQQQVAALTGSIVDLGCGMHDHQRDDVLGVDLDWAMLQQYRGPKLLADVLDPPFEANTFDGVLLFNILDSCRDPFLVLQQAIALLQSGGTLLICCPFAYSEQITPPNKQISEEFVRQFLSQQNFQLKLENHDWYVRSSPRTFITHHCLCIAATAPAS